VINDYESKSTYINNDRHKKYNSNINTELYYSYFDIINSKPIQRYSNYEVYLYKEGDDYEKLILKNKKGYLNK